MICIICNSSKALVRSMCNTCYNRLWRAELIEKVYESHSCCVLCGEAHLAKGLCRTHYMQVYREVIRNNGAES